MCHFPKKSSEREKRLLTQRGSYGSRLEFSVVALDSHHADEKVVFFFSGGLERRGRERGLIGKRGRYGRLQ